MYHTEEEERVDLIIMNTILEGPGEYQATEYDYIEEALKWAKSDILFENKSKEEILAIFRKYETWNEFEEECIKLKTTGL